MRFNKTIAAAAAVAALSAIGTAPAVAGTINSVTAGPIPVILANTSVGTRAGLEYVVTTTDPAGTFASFCLDQNLHYFAPGPDAYTLGAFTDTQKDELSKLFTGAQWKSWDHTNDGVTQGFQQHGLALAVWDIMIDGTLDFSNGTFKVTNDGAGGTAIAFATAAYGMGNTGLRENLRFLDLTDPTLQNMVIAVPEPSTYAMLLAGLAGVGFMARRRQQRSA